MQTRLLLLLCLVGASAAAAHRNERGMDYETYKDARGVSCCNNTDCQPVGDFAEVTVNGQSMVRLLIDGTWYNIARHFVVAENATDGRAHWCGRMITSLARERRPAPICVILPPRDS
jgi:hypothetical protein